MASYLPGLNFPIYSGWTQYSPVIPKLYWDVYSAEQRMKQLCMNFDKVEHYLDYMAELMNQWNIEFTDEMNEQLTALWNTVNGDFEKDFNKWFNENIESYMKKATSMVYFGINLEGYFVAYVPESWSDIIFDTGMVYGLDTYGRLILRYDVDSPYDNVDQTHEIIQEIDEEQLRWYIDNIMRTLYGVNS